MKVKQMISDSGNAIANQFIITNGKSVIFQSYDTIIVKKTKDNIYLDKNYWNCSNTTSKYRNMFLCENIAETRKKINNGTYKMINLNK